MQASNLSPALEVKNLAKRFGQTYGAKSISFTAHRGQITALLGPNGAGKSTTIACATALLKPDSGTVKVLGFDPHQANANQRARMGVMLQEGGLSSSATAKMLLKFASQMFNNPLDRHELAEQLGIKDFINTKVRRLSGGQRQRLALALALIGKPEILFLDEPTSGMDVSMRNKTRELIRAAAQNGTAVILTTHTMTDVEALADKLVLIADGSTIAQGAPGEVLEQLNASKSATQKELTYKFHAPNGIGQDFLADLAKLGQKYQVELAPIDSSSFELEQILLNLEGK